MQLLSEKLRHSVAQAWNIASMLTRLAGCRKSKPTACLGPMSISACAALSDLEQLHDDIPPSDAGSQSGNTMGKSIRPCAGRRRAGAWYVCPMRSFGAASGNRPGRRCEEMFFAACLMDYPEAQLRRSGMQQAARLQGQPDRVRVIAGDETDLEFSVRPGGKWLRLRRQDQHARWRNLYRARQRARSMARIHFELPGVLWRTSWCMTFV